MSTLYETYENAISKNANIEPEWHMYKPTDVEVIIDMEGQFISACTIGKEAESILIPITEDSVSRTSTAIAPHALTDELQYIAGDFEQYSTKAKDYYKKFECYIEQLYTWSISEYKHTKVTAIYNYLAQKRLTLDLINAGIIEMSGNVLAKEENCVKLMPRFQVLGANDGDPTGTWEDKKLIRAYMHYASSRYQKTDLCYFTGNIEPIIKKHAKVSGNAKIISENDKAGFTYRGRFDDSDQAYSLGVEASLKIHNAIRWLIKNQGVYSGNRLYICWNPKGKEVPDIFNELGLDSEETESSLSDGVEYRKKLFKTLKGYRDQFDEDDKVIIMGLEAATPGRLSITYYNELMASDFMDRVTYWGETCSWTYLKFTEAKIPYFTEETPTFRRIIDCAFGLERGDKNKTYIDTNELVITKQIQRLVKCMLDRQPMPRDIVHALTIKASTPLAYSHRNRERILSTACAVITKYYIDIGRVRKGEDEKMRLELDNHDRSYLFGRLLAVLEKVERATYDRGEAREPNAIRLQAAYVNHPFKTWMILEDALKPYFQKLNPGSREYYRRLITEITESFESDDHKILNQGLKENYLLGYYLQRAELNRGHEDKKEVTKDE